MKLKHSLYLILTGVIISSTLNANAQKHLLKCWNQQVKPIQKQHLTFQYTEHLNRLQHSFEPWQQTNYLGAGTIWTNTNEFLKQDSLKRGNRTYYSKTEFNNSILLFLDYGDKELFPVTKEMFLDQNFITARYTPVNILNYFFINKIKSITESDNEFEVFQTTINKTIVKLYIGKKDNLLQKVTTLNDDELFGDVLTTFHYNSYSELGKLRYPEKILIDKINGQVKDEVTISKASISQTKPVLLESPDNYQFQQEEKTNPEITVNKHNDHIHFIELKHTEDRVMVVEFSDFLLVAEAPINSENGELIIAEAKKIAPNKPIKYFVFGHYHPHYLGGVRPFIQEGAKVICSEINVEYLTYIANAPHTLNPDRLQNEPKPLQVELIKDKMIISDGEFDMEIYFIGEKSAHTKDYLIYYFPSDKLLFQDDLVWIKKEGEAKKAGTRQAGLYNAILDLNLNVETIIQSWPVGDYGVKTVIPFKDIKASMEIE